MQSKSLQYTRPDENNKGTKNGGIVGQYPYFAPDQGYMKKAPKMTKADELYLKKFMEAREMADMVRLEEIENDKNRREKADRDYPNPFDVGKINIEVNVNSRLFLERNKHLKAENVQYQMASGEKISLTNKIFGDNNYEKGHEDTTEMVVADWQSSAFAGDGTTAKARPCV